MSELKTSIKIKKFWHSEIASDGGTGNLWKEIQVGTREATLQFNGSDADTTNYKNILGDNVESQTIKGDKTLNFQFADLTPAEIAGIVGGLVTDGTDSIKYEAPLNENQSVEKSLMLLTDKNLLFIVTRASIDGYPVINDDDLHYYQVNSVVLKPTKVTVPSYSYEEIKDASIGKNDITAFTLAAQTGAATINAGTHTVAITVASGTVVTALMPVITTSLGASVESNSGDAKNFTSPVVYTVTSADGTPQTWTVTVTVAA